MQRAGVDEWTFDEEYEITEGDRSHDYLEVVVDVLPKLRSFYAHGTDMLHYDVLHTFELVTEFINQVYPTDGSGDGKVTGRK